VSYKVGSDPGGLSKQIARHRIAGVFSTIWDRLPAPAAVALDPGEVLIEQGLFKNGSIPSQQTGLSEAN